MTLFGAVFTAAPTGAAMLSRAVFLLCALKLARTPVFPGFGTGRPFTFAPSKLNRLRIVQRGGSADEIWSLGESRFFHEQNGVNPVSAGARPFPGDIGLALDRNPVTLRRSWESIHAGMMLEFDFNVPTDLDRVELYCSHGQVKIEVHLDGIDAHLLKTEGHPAGDLRRLDPARRGLRLASREEAGRLYEIQ